MLLINPIHIPMPTMAIPIPVGFPFPMGFPTPTHTTTSNLTDWKKYKPVEENADYAMQNSVDEMITNRIKFTK